MNNRPPPSTVTSLGDPRGVYLQQGPDVLTRTSLTGCVFPRFRSPCFSAPEERVQSVDRSHTVRSAMFPARFQTGHPK
jgi:hypothetical protein